MNDRNENGRTAPRGVLPVLACLIGLVAAVAGTIEAPATHSTPATHYTPALANGCEQQDCGLNDNQVLV